MKVSYSPLGLYMFITEQEAADMYARACRRWYGDEAKSVVSSKIGVLEAKGDHKGVKRGRKCTVRWRAKVATRCGRIRPLP